MGITETVGTAAAICTTGAFIPQILKIRKQGGEDLSYLMLAVYFIGVTLWLIYGLELHAAAMIWANAASALLVAIAIVLKAVSPGRGAAKSSGRGPGERAESEATGD
jgi:MtN3 and saliva related transmembrane protein